MPRALARTVVLVSLLLAAASCGYDASATFNADGSVVVGLKFLFPKALMDSASATPGSSVQGFSPADISKANAQLAAKYPGAKIALVTEGEESGAALTIPFKTEKDAFAFMTMPSQLNPTGATSGSSSGIDLSNTGGLFATATHTTSGQSDTYTFKTQPVALPSASPGSQSPFTGDELASIFTITFSLALPHEITSAPGALFTLDKKTAIWKLSWTQAQTLTATAGPTVALAGFAGGGAQGQSPILLIGVALVAIAAGFALGMFQPWRRRASPVSVPAAAPYVTPPVYTPVSGTPPVMQSPPLAWPAPPPGTPPPNPPGR